MSENIKEEFVDLVQLVSFFTLVGKTKQNKNLLEIFQIDDIRALKLPGALRENVSLFSFFLCRLLKCLFTFSNRKIKEMEIISPMKFSVCRR